MSFVRNLGEFLLQLVQQLLELHVNVVDFGVEEPRRVDQDLVWVDGIFKLPVRKKTFQNV